MRDIVVRSLTSNDWLKRDCLVTERLCQGDTITTVARRCTYRVESRVTMPSGSMEDSVRWARTIDPVPPRQVYVTKDFNPDTGQEQVTYKVLGHLYVIFNQDAFCIGYRHTLTMAVTPSFESEA